MKPVPILTHEWNGTVTGSTATLEVNVDNVGTADAHGVAIYAGFDAGDNMLWNPHYGQPFDLSTGQTKVIRITLQVPSNKHTRIVVQIVDGGYAVDQSYSGWSDT